VLSRDEVLKLIACPDKNTDPRSHLGILLGLLGGMRLGEIRGLLWGDIDENDCLINISHNFLDEDGLKAPKCESSRSIPYPEPVKAAFVAVKKITDKTGAEDFVFPSLDRKGKPLGKGFFEKALKRELESIGIPGKWSGKGPAPEGYIDEQHRRNLPMHATRHTFVTHIRMAGISDIEVQALAGHRSGAMMAHYSHAKQVIDFNQTREKLEAAIAVKQESV
jgi:integrase